MTLEKVARRRREFFWSFYSKIDHWTTLKFIFRWYIILDGYHIGKSSAPQARNLLAYFFEKWPLDPLKFIFRWYIILDGYHIGKSSAPQARNLLAYFFEKWPLDNLKIHIPLVHNFRLLLHW